MGATRDTAAGNGCAALARESIDHSLAMANHATHVEVQTETASALDQLLAAERQADERLHAARADAERIGQAAAATVEELRATASARLAESICQLEERLRVESTAAAAAETSAAQARAERLRAVSNERLDQLAQLVAARLLERWPA